MKNLRIIIPAGVCAIIGIVAVVMLTKGSGEKVLSKSFVGKTGNTTQTVGKTGNTTATLHEYVLARMKRGELDLLNDEERDYFKDAVRVGLIKPAQRDMPVPDPKPVDSRILDIYGNINSTANISDLRDDLRETHDIFRVVPEVQGFGTRDSELPPAYRALPKGTRMREAKGMDTFRQVIGFQGPHRMKDGSGRMVADYPYQSQLLYNNRLALIPLITKNTSKKELDYLLSGKDPKDFPGLIERAESSAAKRIEKGLSPFYAGAGSERLTPLRSYHP